MSAYRFCRTDDIGLLVEALNRCWAPYVPDQAPATVASFKGSIRDVQVWCSSCMVAFAGPEPVGVLIGAKRASATLVHTIAVHPDHRRQGHARHLLDSLGSKLAILGPPRIVAEVPEAYGPACALFEASGYTREALLADYVWHGAATDAGPVERRRAIGARGDTAGFEGFVIPITIDDLAANGLLTAADARACWARSIETLTARKDAIAGLAAVSDERIEAYVLYTGCGEIVALRSLVDDHDERLRRLLSELGARGAATWRFRKVHPDEIATARLDRLGFRAAAAHRLYAARARSS